MCAVAVRHIPNHEQFKSDEYVDIKMRNGREYFLEGKKGAR